MNTYTPKHAPENNEPSWAHWALLAICLLATAAIMIWENI